MRKMVFVAGASRGESRHNLSLQPNNPTGAVATKGQLKTFVDYALKIRLLSFLTQPMRNIFKYSLPKSIYEIEGAKKCAIEINSFQNGLVSLVFAWVWTVVPLDLMVEDGQKGKSTLFGADAKVEAKAQCIMAHQI